MHKLSEKRKKMHCSRQEDMQPTMVEVISTFDVKYNNKEVTALMPDEKNHTKTQQKITVMEINI